MINGHNIVFTMILAFELKPASRHSTIRKSDSKMKLNSVYCRRPAVSFLQRCLRIKYCPSCFCFCFLPRSLETRNVFPFLSFLFIPWILEYSFMFFLFHQLHWYARIVSHPLFTKEKKLFDRMVSDRQTRKTTSNFRIIFKMFQNNRDVSVIGDWHTRTLLNAVMSSI